MKIFLDFDNCLFDTTRYPGTFWQDFCVILKTGGWSEEEIEKTMESFSDNAFDTGQLYRYRSHLELLEKVYPHRKLKDTLQVVDVFMRHLEKYLFPDVLPFLTSLNPENIVFVTYGDNDFQRAKIVGAHIEKYASEILVTHGEKLKMIEQWVAKNLPSVAIETLWYVDDKSKYFFQKGVLRRPKTVLMQRGIEARKSEDTDYVVKNCTELLTLIQETKT